MAKLSASPVGRTGLHWRSSRQPRNHSRERGRDDPQRGPGDPAGDPGDGRGRGWRGQRWGQPRAEAQPGRRRPGRPGATVTSWSATEAGVSEGLSLVNVLCIIISWVSTYKTAATEILSAIIISISRAILLGHDNVFADLYYYSLLSLFK